MKKNIIFVIILSFIFSCWGCNYMECELRVFVAASLKSPMEEIANNYEELNPSVKIILNADNSGKLLLQIEEGYDCDIFFSASKKQMDRLEEDGLLINDSRKNVLKNQLVVIKGKESKTSVTGLCDIEKAESIAIAGESVPAGEYTREALFNLGKLKSVTDNISDSLGGVEISEQDNVSKVLIAVKEGSCEVGTTYLSDTYGYEDEIVILETIPDELSKDVVYPIARISNSDKSQDFINYILSEESQSIFEKYKFTAYPE